MVPYSVGLSCCNVMGICAYEMLDVQMSGHCILCGKDIAVVADNRGHAQHSWRTFAMRIPRAEVLVCYSCDLAWVRIDGMLTGIGKPWQSAQDTRIPDGVLAVFGEQCEQG